MALIFTDPNSAGPFSTFQVKDQVIRVFQLLPTAFTTGNTDTLLGRLPADASIVGIQTWVQTALTGNGVTLPVISLGTASGGTQFCSTFAVTNTTGTFQTVSPVTGILQAYNVPLGQEISIWCRGGCSTGNPTGGGNVYVMVEYVR